MGRALVLVCCTAACRFDLPEGPGPGDDGGANVDTGSGDRDSDGVADADDKCPDAFDPLQRDHDNDGFGDVCDGCPPFASATNTDTDGDGVGDECDPNPDTPGDHIAVWFGFYDEDAPTVLGLPRSGDWTVSGDALHTTNSASSSSFLRGPAAIGRAVQFTHITLDDFSAANAAIALESGEVLNGANLVQLYECALFRSNSELSAKAIAGNQRIDEQKADYAGSLANGTQLDMTAQLVSGLQCDVSPPLTTRDASAEATAGLIALFAQQVDLSFDYWFVIDAGAP